MAYNNSKLTPLPFNDTQWANGFWKEKETVCEKNTLLSMYEKLNDDSNSVSFKNFHIIAENINDTYKGSTYWGDGDCYKWLEAATYIYSKTKDQHLKSIIDKEIEAIVKTQREDGYIHTYIQMTEDAKPFTIKMYHEDYNFGHLFTLGVKHHQLIKEDALYNVAIKAADLLYEKFINGDGTTKTFGWNPSHIMGLVNLYRESNNKNYLELAKWFVKDKASDGVRYEIGTNDDMQGFACGGGDQNQERTPLENETKPEGHAVTATYLYAGASDICIEEENKKLEKALTSISKHLYSKRVYITGGVGTYHFGYSSSLDPVHEAFARDYDLTATTAYNETCANVGNAMWNWRMYLLTGDEIYANNIENVMYNSGISGISIDGTKYRYTNPTKWRGRNQELQSNDSLEKWDISKCYCCPPQMARTLASMNQFIASKADNELHIDFYGDSTINTVINNKIINIKIETNFPWNGNVKIIINDDIKDFNLYLRIPSWSKKTLFKYKSENTETTNQKVKKISGDFKKGEIISLDFDMRIRKIQAHPYVEAANNHMAFMRGPLVYCLESTDLKNYNDFSSISIKSNAIFTPKWEKDLLGGVITLNGKGLVEEIDSNLYSEINTETIKECDIKLIPYYSWNNRGISEMEVWIPRR